jgi:hypothetical protein
LSIYPDNFHLPTLFSGEDRWMELLKKQFPDEQVAIDKYFKLIHGTDGSGAGGFLIKSWPLWFSWLYIKIGLPSLSGFYSGKYSKTHWSAPW